MSKTQLIISLPNLFVFQGFSTQHLHLFRRESLKFKNHPWPLTLLHLYIKSVTKVNSCNPLNVSQIPTPHCVTFHLNTRIATSMASCFHSEYTLLSALHRNVFQINLIIFLCLEILKDSYVSQACKALFTWPQHAQISITFSCPSSYYKDSATLPIFQFLIAPSYHRAFRHSVPFVLYHPFP